jgi:2-polyprenyl-3-methyl-5-hydroxy-6-metoxy-1,4-benzoquinol methylase
MSSLRHALAAPLKWVPEGLRYRMIQVLLTPEETRDPERALSSFFKIEDHLTWHINRTAVDYDRGVHAKHRLTKYHDFFVDRITEGERVLDIGCGYGAVAHSVASQAGAKVLGIDINPDNIRRATEMFDHGNLRYTIGDVLVFLPDEPFDTMVFSNVLEHIEHRVAFLTRVQKQLNPNRWLIRVPMINRDWRVPLRKELGITYFSDGTHYTEYTEESFADEMAEAGLHISHLQVNWGEIWAEVRANA